MCTPNANVQHSGNSVHRNPPVLNKKSVHVSNVRITDGCAGATWATSITDACSAFLKSLYPLLHFPFTHTASIILLNLPRFHSFWPHNSYYSILLLSGAIFYWGVLILALSFELHLSCHRLHAVRTRPIDVCAAVVLYWLRLMLLNIQSICPYLLKCLRSITPPDMLSHKMAMHVSLHQFMTQETGRIWLRQVYTRTRRLNDNFVTTSIMQRRSIWK
jgi:hypothetical protein